jgi:hypothetical protein
MSTPSQCEANDAFAAHFARYVGAAARSSLIAAAQTETDRLELLLFAEALFHDLIHRFEDSFVDCWMAIGPSFQHAARGSMPGRRP